MARRASRLNPKFKLRLVFDCFPPTKVRGYDFNDDEHATMRLVKAPGTAVAGEPWHTASGWTTKPQILSEDSEHASVATMAGTWGPDLLETSIGRKSSKPGAFTGTPQTSLLSVRKNAYAADGTSNFSVSGGETGPTWEHPSPIERWFVSTNDYSPDAPLFFVFQLPPNTRQGPVARLYFGGPWGAVNGVAGNGRYCLTLYLDGSAKLQEHTGSAWFEHARFRLFSRTLSGGSYWLLIKPHAVYNGSAWVGSSISFSGAQNSLIDTLASVMIGALRDRGAQTGGIDEGITLSVNDGSVATSTLTEGKIIVEVRRDVSFQVHISEVAQPDGEFVDHEVYIENGDIDATADYPIWLSWFGAIPTGADLDATLYGWNGSAWEACSPTDDRVATVGGYYRPFQLVAGAKRYRVLYQFTANTGGRAPTLKSRKLYRQGRYGFADGITPKTVERWIDEVYIDDGGPDPTQQFAEVVFYDKSLSNPFELRSEVPIRIEADIKDPRDPTVDLTATLFVGRVLECASQPTTHQLDSNCPPGYCRRRKCICIGEGIRLTEMIANCGIKLTDPGDSTESGDQKPLKVTEAIKLVFGQSGTPSSGTSSMLDCPDYGMRLSVANASDQMYLEAFSDLAGPIREWVEEYLGCYLAADYSAAPEGADPDAHQWGMFRVLEYPEGTEQAVARFVESVPAYAGQEGLVKVVGPWGALINPNETPSERIATALVESGDAANPLEIRIVAPEMNEIYVTGVGVPAPTGGLLKSSSNPTNAVQLPAVLRNYKSARFTEDQAIEPDPTSMDYLGRVKTSYVANVGWSTQQVVDNIAKRKMRMAGQGYAIKTFQAAALFMRSAADARQVRPRPVKFGDVVEYVDTAGIASKWIVARARLSIHQHHGGTRFARMVYQIHSPLPDTWPVDRSDQS